MGVGADQDAALGLEAGQPPQPVEQRHGCSVCRARKNALIFGTFSAVAEIAQFGTTHAHAHVHSHCNCRRRLLSIVSRARSMAQFTKVRFCKTTIFPLKAQ